MTIRKQRTNILVKYIEVNPTKNLDIDENLIYLSIIGMIIIQAGLNVFIVDIILGMSIILMLLLASMLMILRQKNNNIKASDRFLTFGVITAIILETINVITTIHQ